MTEIVITGDAAPAMPPSHLHPPLHRRTPHRAEDWFSADELAETRRYARPRNRAVLAATSASIAALVVFVFAEGGPRLLGALDIRGWVLQLAAVVLAATTIATVATVAPIAYISLVHDKRWGLSTNNAKTFFLDQLKQLAISAVCTTAMLVPVYAAIRAMDWWFVWGWAGFMAVLSVIFFVHPVLVMPRFNKFTPMPDGELRDRVEAIAAMTGTVIQGVYTMDASKRTRRSNAYVAGFGATKRVVLYDTMLEYPIELIEQVVAHELGHYRLRHVPRMFAAIGALYLVAFAFVGVVGRWPWLLERAGVETLGDPGSVPLLFLLLGVVGTALAGVQAWHSRLLERQADLEALQLLRRPDDFIELWRRMAPKDRMELQPSWWSRFTGSHPEVAERMAFAQAWAATSY